MKKLKFLPSVLMMIMCVGVLAVGVFAISPIVSTIGGTLSISAAQGVKVAVYNSESMSANSLVDSAFGGVATEVNLGKISLDGSTASTASDVTPKVFYIKLTTNQDKNYVVDTETIEYIDGVGVTSGEIVKNAGLVTKMHTYTATDGKGRACFNKTNPYTIKLSIKCGALSTEVVNMAFNLALNIYEENDSNFTDTEINGVDYLMFGSYPQSLASETLTGYTPNGETYGAYDDNGGEIQRPIYTKDGDTSGDRFVELNSKLYKIEPLKWNILDQNTSGSLANTTGNTMLVSDLVLEQVPFYTSTSTRTIDGVTVYPNNYKESTLRNFLRTTFLNNAFSSIQQELIKITSVQNDASTTNNSSGTYVCADTDDMVFSLSYQDAINADYYTTDTGYTTTRMKHTSDYGTATGVYGDDGGLEAAIEEENSCCGYYEDTREGAIEHYVDCYGYPEDVATKAIDEGPFSLWWLRSPYSTYSSDAWLVYYGARVHYGHVIDSFTGCVPALHLSL